MANNSDVTAQDCNINVSVWHQFSERNREGSYSTSYAQLLVIPKVEITYQSELSETVLPTNHSSKSSAPSSKPSKPTKLTDIHNVPKFFKLDCHKLLLGNSSSWDIILGIISDMKLSFSLDHQNLNWRVQDRPMQCKPWIQLQNQDDLVKKLLDVACCLCYEKEERYLTMYLNVKKVVILPETEFEALLKHREKKEVREQRNNLVSLIIDYQVSSERNLTPLEWMMKISSELRVMNVAINRKSLKTLGKRAYGETEGRILMGLKPARLSSIEGLETMEIEDHDLKRGCSICGEDMVVGDFAKRMPSPCLHMFHVNCIDKWLSINHVCPMCRYELPTKV